MSGIVPAHFTYCQSHIAIPRPWEQGLDGYDLQVSNFGVMLFGDPVTAFAHVRGAASLAREWRLCAGARFLKTRG
jgi:hypothetical protein